MENEKLENEQKPGFLKRLAWQLGLTVLVIAAIIVIIIAWPRQKGPTSVPGTPAASSTDAGLINPAQAAAFGTYVPTPVSYQAQVPAYTVNPDLSNVTNAADFSYFSTTSRALLAKNGFVVVPSYNNEFFPVYEANRYDYTPNFVTVDSLLHNYHLVYDDLLKHIEEDKLAGGLKQLSGTMLSAAETQYASLKGTAWENAARRNVAFFAVAASLLDPATTIPAEVKPEVDQELSLIAAHQGIAVSPVMNLGESQDLLEALKEDYSQYIPRGHYAGNTQLEAYFKAMMWYGRLTFRLKSPDEVKSAVLITLALGQDDNLSAWNRIYDTVNFFVGKSDDIDYYQFNDLLKSVYGSAPDLTVLISSPDKLDTFISEAAKLNPPQINSVPIFNAKIQPDRTKEIMGFRFMGQRFTVDAAIFQHLVDREVPNRMLPKSLDIPAALGSQAATDLLAQSGDTNYQNYLTNLSALQSNLASRPTSDWTQNLYWGWLYGLRPLLTPSGAGYPAFMQTAAWTMKNLNSFLGSWTELKHDTLLYAKQVYAELGGGGPPDAKDDRGYVEPAPEVYGRLASLLQLTTDGLGARGLLNADEKNNLDLMQTLALSLKTIAEKELNNQAPSDADYELIRSYGGQLEHFWLSVNQQEMDKQQLSQMNYLNQNPAAIVADVATDPNGQVLEEATGRLNDIYVVVPVAGHLRIAKGAVYSYYEFTQPLSGRLDDQTWRNMLDNNQAPAAPAWTASFLGK